MREVITEDGGGRQGEGGGERQVGGKRERESHTIV